MAVLVALSLLLIAGFCHGESGRIVGGNPVSLETYPSLVQVDFMGVQTYAWGQSCAANILNSLYVLSAAHCFAGSGYLRFRRRIRAGAPNSNTGGVIIPIDREFNHPSYISSGIHGDISVVRLTSHLSFNSVIQPGVIVAQDTIIPDFHPVFHAGWGRTQQGGQSSPILLHTQIFTINNDLCRERYMTLNYPGVVVTRNMICAGLPDVGGSGHCQGDAGGPLYYQGIIIGVISWGYGCAHATFPGISTAVAPYTNWIRNTAR